MILCNPWLQGIEGALDFLVRKSKRGATKVFSGFFFVFLGRFDHKFVK